MELKTELYLKLFCVFILTVLCISVYINGQTLTCEKCAIKLEASKPILTASSEIIFDADVKFEDLLNSIKNDTCVLKWMETQGWVHFK